MNRRRIGGKLDHAAYRALSAPAEVAHEFRSAIAAAGLTPPETIEADGRLHRFASNGKRGDLAGWYVLHADGIPAGAFGCWRAQLVEHWHADPGRALTDAERDQHRQRMESVKREREQAERERHAEAAERAAREWEAAEPAPAEHPYLTRKGVQAHSLRVDADGRLLVPVRSGAGEWQSLQRIAADGEKRFIEGGMVTGGYFAIGGKPADTLCIAEGFATAASIHEAAGYPVAVAFNAGNLPAVARALHEKLPACRLIVCADDDAMTEGNPGVTKGREAALAVGGLLAVPDFGPNRPDKATDFNDLAQSLGPDAVRECIDRAKAPAPTTCEPADEKISRVEFLCAADVTPEPISWLWPGWLAAGKVHVLGGAPGTGKTTISMGLAATVTIGGRWPDGTRSPAGNVVIWSGEDDPADTLIPRLVLSGADLSHIYFVADILDGGERRSFDPARDMELLRRKLAEVGDVRLLIVDPIVSAITGDSHKNAEVRRGLQPLADLAASMRCALLGITHFSKGTSGREPVERITGSLAFGALARIVMVAAKHQEAGDDGRTARLFCRAKSNIGPDDGGYEYELHQAEIDKHPGVFASSVRWGKAVQGAARDLLAVADATGDDGEGGALADAKEFLASLLKDGALATKTIRADAAEAGYSWSTIRRAKEALEVRAKKDGMQGGWRWSLPDRDPVKAIIEATKALKKPEDAQQKEVGPFGESEHLRDDLDPRIVEAAYAAGIPADLLAGNLTAGDLDDPGLDLLAYARSLAPEVQS